MTAMAGLKNVGLTADDGAGAAAGGAGASGAGVGVGAGASWPCATAAAASHAAARNGMWRVFKDASCERTCRAEARLVAAPPLRTTARREESAPRGCGRRGGTARRPRGRGRRERIRRRRATAPREPRQSPSPRSGRPRSRARALRGRLGPRSSRSRTGPADRTARDAVRRTPSETGALPHTAPPAPGPRSAFDGSSLVQALHPGFYSPPGRPRRRLRRMPA